MTPYSKSLDVYINDNLIGVAHQDDAGRFEFAYHSNYDSTPLSLSMPVTNEPYRNKVVRPYLMGLLPDNRSQREALANQHDVSANNPIALLNYIGLDCPGAVQFVPSTEANGLKQKPGRYTALSEGEIKAELERIIKNGQASWQLPKEHWSLGGTQSKIALARFDGQWFRCEGAAATTHIIKPGIAQLQHEALNECICQNIAAASGLLAAKASFEVFDGIPALVSERFDRDIVGLKRVRRIHQEDFCQALSIDPENKYASEGGPTPSSILHLLNKHANPLENKIQFTMQLFFNYLIGAPDAHGKNYSVLLEGKDVRLAPLYDCASALAYDGEQVDYRSAMTIGGERDFFQLKKRDIIKYAEQAQLSDETCFHLMSELAENILETQDDIFAQFDEFEGAKELSDRMKPKISNNCKSIIRNLK